MRNYSSKPVKVIEDWARANLRTINARFDSSRAVYTRKHVGPWTDANNVTWVIDRSGPTPVIKRKNTEDQTWEDANGWQPMPVVDTPEMVIHNWANRRVTGYQRGAGGQGNAWSANSIIWASGVDLHSYTHSYRIATMLEHNGVRYAMFVDPVYSSPASRTPWQTHEAHRALPPDVVVLRGNRLPGRNVRDWLDAGSHAHNLSYMDTQFKNALGSLTRCRTVPYARMHLHTMQKYLDNSARYMAMLEHLGVECDRQAHQPTMFSWLERTMKAPVTGETVYVSTIYESAITESDLLKTWFHPYQALGAEARNARETQLSKAQITTLHKLLKRFKTDQNAKWNHSVWSSYLRLMEQTRRKNVTDPEHQRLLQELRDAVVPEEYFIVNPDESSIRLDRLFVESSSESGWHVVTSQGVRQSLNREMYQGIFRAALQAIDIAAKTDKILHIHTGLAWGAGKMEIGPHIAVIGCHRFRVGHLKDFIHHLNTI